MVVSPFPLLVGPGFEAGRGVYGACALPSLLVVKKKRRNNSEYINMWPIIIINVLVARRVIIMT